MRRGAPCECVLRRPAKLYPGCIPLWT